MNGSKPFIIATVIRIRTRGVFIYLFILLLEEEIFFFLFYLEERKGISSLENFSTRVYYLSFSKVSCWIKISPC